MFNDVSKDLENEIKNLENKNSVEDIIKETDESKVFYAKVILSLSVLLKNSKEQELNEINMDLVMDLIGKSVDILQMLSLMSEAYLIQKAIPDPNSNKEHSKKFLIIVASGIEAASIYKEKESQFRILYDELINQFEINGLTKYISETTDSYVI